MKKKTRQEREEELHRVADHGGRDQIVELYKEAIGLPPWGCPAPGTMLKGEMIPAILNHEYPNG
jgi:hypothetical protein